MSITRKAKKRIRGWSIFGAIVLILVLAWNLVLPRFDGGGYRYVAVEVIKSFFKASSNESVDEVLRKTGGVVKGVCHPNENYEQIQEANIEWVRLDLTSLPYDENGNPTEGYLAFKERAKGYADKGMKVMCVTQYPSVFIDAGYDPRNEAGREKIKEMAAFIAQDLQGYVAGFQITNEMGIEHFTLPLTLEEASLYIGVQLEAMEQYKKDIIVGYNLAGFTMYQLCELMKPWNKYCDYIGLDLYLGCFEGMFKELYIYDGIMRFMWSYTGLPVIVNEFGYMGYGDVKSEEAKNAILKQYGFNSEAEARADVMKLINNENFPEKFRRHLLGLEYANDKELSDKLFDTELSNHLYKELKGGYQLNKYRHTVEDQGRFFTDVIERFKKMDFCCGAIVYCYSDSDACYICGQPDCPVETGWGLVDGEGNPKPSYLSIKEAFKNWEK